MKILRFLMLVLALGGVSQVTQLNAASCHNIYKVYFHCERPNNTYKHEARTVDFTKDQRLGLPPVHCMGADCYPMNSPENEHRIANVRKWANEKLQYDLAKSYCTARNQDYAGSWTATNEKFGLAKCSFSNK